tara:strand:- start:50 stop:1447 length:1398 start_codon:yes stop_codon:yes gene_type:complete
VIKIKNTGQFKKLTKDEVVKRLEKIFKDEKYNYEFIRYKGTRKEIKVFCPKKNHGFFERRPEILFKKRGCFRCLKDRDKQTFINKVNKIHSKKYDYSLVNYVNYHQNIIVICDVEGHGHFTVTPDNHHYNKSGCPICGRLKLSLNQRKTQKKFIKEFRKLFKNKYSLKKLTYQGAKVPIIIICNNHGEHTTTPDSILRGNKPCFDCGLIERGLKKRSTTNYFIERAREVHGSKYDYSKSKYIKAKKLIKIVCKKHKEFYQLADVHLAGAGCNKCGYEIVSQKKRNSIEKVIRILEEKRGKDRFDYTLIHQTYKTNKSILTLRCLTHNKVFYQNASDHAVSGGCEDCKYKSIGEELVMSILSEINIEYIHNWGKHDCKLGKGKAKFDFYLPDHNLIIEYDGEQHFKPVQFGGMSKINAMKDFNIRKKYDKIKSNWATNKRINFLRIKYNENAKRKIFHKIKTIQIN